MEKKTKKVLYDHYSLLGLSSGEEGTKLDEIAIRKAYRAKALQLHPNKSPNDPDANAEFQGSNLLMRHSWIHKPASSLTLF
ncbi:hypothetical protein M0R45_015299 [Rubus argutus]|uniref:J domain-containing protein n=1 Tax=Rubus argutus TaxID=59490 RepID=A0AAW1XP90_RUBAR